MRARMIQMDDKTDYHKLEAPAKELAQGGLVAFPTETVYGLGANALDEQAVKRIYIAKGRPSDNPLIVHVAAKEAIAPLVETIPAAAEKVIEAFCPGPITLVLQKSKLVPDAVTAGGTTVAIRIPEHQIARKLIEMSGVPVAAPSANISGRPSPTTATHVAADLSEQISYIIDGGPCRVGLESTVVDFTVQPPRILRPGGISHEELCSLLGEVEGYAPQDSDTLAPKSPGMKYKHYAPKAEVIVYEGPSCRAEIIKRVQSIQDKTVCVLTAGATNEYPCSTIDCGDTADGYAKTLFDALRQADDKKADLIFAEFPFASGGIATALRNRIYKSCGGNVILCK